MRRGLIAAIMVGFTTAVVACTSSDGDAPDTEGSQDGGRASGRDGGPGGANGGGGTSTSGGGGDDGGGGRDNVADGGGGNTGGARTDGGADVDASIGDGGSNTGGDGGSSSTDAGPNDGGADVDAAVPEPYALTSTALAEGGQFDVANTCNGANTSPPLAWTAGPAGTMSYALVLADTSPEPDVLHWVIYDIPSSRSSLPADVQKVYQPANVADAKQTQSFNAAVRGYLGPCPGSEHTYQFALYALDVAVLPGATMATTRAQALAIIEMHDLAVAELTGTYAP